MAKTRRQGQIINKGKDRWLVRVYLGTDSKNGSRLYDSEVIRGKIGDANRLLNEKIARKEKGQLVRKTVMSFGEYLDEWLETTAKLRVREATYQSYKNHLTLYVDDGTRAVPLSKLRTIHIQRMVSALAGTHSPRTVRYVYTIVKNALKKAKAMRLIHENPCENVELPKRMKRTIEVFTVAAARRFVKSLDGNKHGLVLEFALVTGARPEEYLALKWPDLDMNRNRVTFNRTLIWRAGGGWYFDDQMKTVHSRRSLQLPEPLIAKLRIHKRLQAEQMMELGPAYQRNDLIFATEIGSPLNHRNLAQRYFKLALNKAGLGHFTLYSLRHSCATLLLSEGVNIKVIQERLGHADVSLTLSTYSHVLDGMQEHATQTIGCLLYDGDRSKQAHA